MNISLTHNMDFKMKKILKKKNMKIKVMNLKIRNKILFLIKIILRWNFVTKIQIFEQNQRTTQNMFVTDIFVNKRIYTSNLQYIYTVLTYILIYNVEFTVEL